MKRTAKPSTLLSTVVVVVLVCLWGWIRLVAFKETISPLSYVIPLMVCVWTRRKWHLVAMAVVFLVFAYMKFSHVIASDAATTSDYERQVWLWTTVVNIAVGTGVVFGIMLLRRDLEEQNRVLGEQRAELEAQAEELTQQNEEIRAQSEELECQNEELRNLGYRISRREALLHGLLESVRVLDSSTKGVEIICQRTVDSLGEQAECVGLLILAEGRLRLHAQWGKPDGPRFPEYWPEALTLCSVVLTHRRTAFVSDLQLDPNFSTSGMADSKLRSLIATPVEIEGQLFGVLVSGGRHVSDWTEEQFQLIEWTAAQAALLMELTRRRDTLERRAAEIEKASRTKDDFLAMLSHELRTPLTPVLALASELENDSTLTASLREDLGVIKRNVEIQSRLIDDLLDLTKITRNKMDLEKRTFDVGVAIKEACAIVAPDVRHKNQRIELNWPEEQIWIHGDLARVEQVFWNLLKNAVRYSPVSATIRVTRAIVPNRVVVSVVDHGLGLAPTDVERIFHPFEQVAAGIKRRRGDGGLGLGLAIAKAVVELHGGKIWAESPGPGQGSTFHVEFPLAAPYKQSNSPFAATTAHPTNGRPLSILLVEDHVDTGKVIMRLLQHAGYAVRHARNAAEARAFFDSERCDLLISDIGLPDESGVELMRNFRTLHPSLKGICLSGYGMEQDIAAYRAVGFNEHLTKPVDVRRLRTAVVNAEKQLSTPESPLEAGA
ncbi:MAG: ATP-binding protein [Nibricoccus sp.]